MYGLKEPSREDADHWVGPAGGFSMLELLLTLIVVAILIGVSLPTVESAVRQARADTAMNLVLTQLRLARQMAVDERRVTRVVVNNSGTVGLARRELSGSWTLLSQKDLPQQAQFRLEPGIPTSPSDTPDGLGAGSPIDLAGSNQVFFTPEGSATDGAARLVNGIVYLAIPGHLETARAVTVFGSTGRLRAWWLRETVDGWKWE